MRILSSFDTKTDAEELLDAVHKYWEWNVILVKKHWIKLIIPLFLVVLSIFLLNLMLYVIYIHIFEENKVMFWILAIFYAYTTISRSAYTVFWIMANIIWQIQSKTKYIDNSKMAAVKQRAFERFLKRTLLTFTVHLLVLIFNATVPFIVINNTWLWSIAAAVGALIIDIVFLFIVNRVMYQLIEYEMNFGICSPESFKLFKQTWILTSDVTDISPQSINIIKYKRKWLFESLFHYWSVCLYTDAEIRNEQGSVIEFKYIPDPKNIVKKLNQILGKIV